MGILTTLATLIFYLQHALTMVIVLFINLTKFLWKVATKKDYDKQHLDPLKSTHPDVFTDLYDFVSSQGFDLEVFRFQTTDRASVEMWRIYQKGCRFTKPYPILLMHGLLDCSVSWFLQVDKTKSLPYILAAEGYEVWVGNNRGNRISLQDGRQDDNYWDYSLDHLIEFDQPTIIQGVVKASKKEKIVYVGHSQGSAQFVLSMGVHEHLHHKIASFVGLGTVVSLANMDHKLLDIVGKFKLMELANFIGLKRLLILPKFFSKTVGVMIYNSKVHSKIIMLFIRWLCGFNHKDKIPTDYFGVMLTHEPGGASPNNVLQWINCYRTGEMKRFDHGKQKNKAIYGTQEPTNYGLKHLERLPFKSHLFKGSKDAVMSEENFKKLVSHFNPEKIKTYKLEDYHHLQYLWSETAHVDIYPQVLKIVQECSHEL